MGSENRYVYGITEATSPVDFAVDGVGGASRVYTITHRDLGALVSDVEPMDPDESEENLTAHDRVLRTAMTADPGRSVVPMRFGMVFENERSLKHVLRSGRRAFTAALEEIEGMVELGVKVVAPNDDTPAGDEIRSAVDRELDPPSVDVSEGDQFSDRLVVNRSYLVERSDREDFDEAIDRLRRAHDDVTIQYTGPWAPYNFVDIRIGVAQ